MKTIVNKLLTTAITLLFFQISFSQYVVIDTIAPGNFKWYEPKDSAEYSVYGDCKFTYKVLKDAYEGDSLIYYLKFVKINLNETPDDAIKREATFTATDGPWKVTKDGYYYSWKYFDSNPGFEYGRAYAYQVTAVKNDTLFAISKARTYFGPKVFNTAYVNNKYELKADWFTDTGNGYSNLSGFGTLTFKDKTIPVEFKNLTKSYSFGLYTITKGQIYGAYNDTIYLEYDNQQATPDSFAFEYDSIYIDAGAITTEALCQISPTVVINNTPKTFYINQKILLEGDNELPVGDLKLPTTNIIDNNITFTLDDNYLSIINKKFKPVYNGNAILSSEYGNLSFAINSLNDLDYYSTNTKGVFNLSDQLRVAVYEITYDNREDISPKPFDTNNAWKGITLNKFEIDDIEQDSLFAIDFIIDLIDSISNEWQGYFTDSNLFLKIDKTFDDTLKMKYNYFNSGLLTLSIEKNTDSLYFNMNASIESPYFNEEINLNIKSENGIIQLATTNEEALFKPFYLYEFYLDSLSFITEHDTVINCNIDHLNKTINIETKYEEDPFYYLTPYFSFAGQSISIDDQEIVHGISTVSTYIHKNHSLNISNYEGKTISYDITINQSRVEQDTVGTKLNELNNITIFPNPTSDIINIQGLKSNTRVSIYNALGQLISFSESNKNQITENISEYNIGIYFIRIEHDGNIITKKITKR